MLRQMMPPGLFRWLRGWQSMRSFPRPMLRGANGWSKRRLVPRRSLMFCWQKLQRNAVGYAVIFETYSTFLARPKLFLEDLFVKPEFRGSGAGHALIRACAREAVARGCARMEWVVLDWNEPAIKFYEARGASHLKEWYTFALDEAELKRL